MSEILGIIFALVFWFMPTIMGAGLCFAGHIAENKSLKIILYIIGLTLVIGNIVFIVLFYFNDM